MELEDIKSVEQYFKAVKDNFEIMLSDNMEIIEEHIQDLPDYEEDDELPYAYFVLDWNTMEWEYSQVCFPDYYPHGFTDELGLHIHMVDNKTTVQEILEEYDDDILWQHLPQNLEFKLKLREGKIPRVIDIRIFRAINGSVRDYLDLINTLEDMNIEWYIMGITEE